MHMTYNINLSTFLSSELSHARRSVTKESSIDEPAASVSTAQKIVKQQSTPRPILRWGALHAHAHTNTLYKDIEPIQGESSDCKLELVLEVNHILLLSNDVNIMIPGRDMIS